MTQAARSIAKLTTVGRLGPDAWRAHDSAVGDCVLTLVDPEELVRRRRVYRKLDHPRTRGELTVVDVPDRGPALVTTYLAGVPLAEVDRTRALTSPRDPREVVRIGVEILAILAHAHQREVVHGCLAMRHIIVGESVGLVGFGQAPEHARPRDDFRALAAILYELLTGEAWGSWAPPASYFRPDLGQAFDEWLETLGDPERTFRDAEEMRASLRAVGGTMPPPAMPEPSGHVAV